MTRGYRAGADLERATRDDLAACGYFVIRSAGSKTPVDLAAFKAETLFVQCKASGVMSRGSLTELRDLAGRFDAVPLVAFWHKPGRAARTIAYRRVMIDLDGKVRARMDWTPDWALEAGHA